MKTYITFLAIALLSITVQPSVGQTQPNDRLAKYLKDSLAYVTKQVAKSLGKRYMEGEVLTKKTDMPGWEGITVTLYKYSVNDIRTGNKEAKVYLCDASNEQIARWVITACWLNKHSFNAGYITKIIARIKGESGGQFAVMGIVYEDQYKAGEQIPYAFKDGVTVGAKQAFKNDTASPEEVEYCLHLTNDKITSGRYGRIASTIREEYKAAGGKDDVGTSTNRKIAWLATVRDLYKKALNNDNNELITAWAKANLK